MQLRPSLRFWLRQSGGHREVSPLDRGTTCGAYKASPLALVTGGHVGGNGSAYAPGSVAKTFRPRGFLSRGMLYPAFVQYGASGHI